MVDIEAVRNASRLRWLKWLCTFCASVAIIIALGILINWVTGVHTYRWFALPIALASSGIALVTRSAIGSKLSDKQ